MLVTGILKPKRKSSSDGTGIVVDYWMCYRHIWASASAELEVIAISKRPLFLQCCKVGVIMFIRLHYTHCESFIVHKVKGKERRATYRCRSYRWIKKVNVSQDLYCNSAIVQYQRVVIEIHKLPTEWSSTVC